MKAILNEVCVILYLDSPQIQLSPPEVNSIYKGRVTGVMDYGCFASLLSVKGRCEGLIHVSQMSAPTSGRITDPRTVVSRGDEVYVKIISIQGTRMRLSMRQACQKTGQDIESGELYVFL